MCTYLVFHEAFGPGTVGLAANRDEAVDRPFDAPAIHAAAGVPSLYARDHRGGTWLGTNGALLLALTNAPLPGEDAARRSRGLLVTELLARRAVDDAFDRLARAVAADRYDGFNLVIAGKGAALVATHGPSGLVRHDLPPGAHLVIHREPGTRPFGGVTVERGADPETVLRHVASTILASHDPLPDTGHPPCRHEGARGTVATTLAFLDAARPDRSFLLFSRGAACRARFLPHALPAA